MESSHSPTTKFTCCASGCTNVATLACPYCKSSGLLTDEVGRYCANDCFKAAWSTHKFLHKPIAVAGTSTPPAAAVPSTEHEHENEHENEHEKEHEKEHENEGGEGRKRSPSTSALSTRYDGHAQTTPDAAASPGPGVGVMAQNNAIGTNAYDADADDDDDEDDSLHNTLPPPVEQYLPYLPNFYDWRRTYPQLKILMDNIELLKAEAKTVRS
jgi:hypothetical protein